MPSDLTSTDSEFIETVECFQSAEQFRLRLKALMQDEPIYVVSIKDDEFRVSLSANIERRYYCVSIRGEIYHEGANYCEILLYRTVPTDLVDAFFLQFALLVGALSLVSLPILSSNDRLVGFVLLALMGLSGLIALFAIMYVQMKKQSNKNLRRQLLSRIKQCAD